MIAIAPETLITYNPWTVRPRTLLDEVAAQFESLGCHHVAVVNDDRELVGILSETDLLRARQRQRALPAAAGGYDPDLPETVGEAMTTPVVSIGPDMAPRKILQHLLAHRIHALPVVEAGRLVGMITSRDFVREFSYGELVCSREPVAKIVKTPLEPLDTTTRLDEALLLMQEAGVSCLVVAQGGCPLGVVSQRDIVRARCQIENEAGPECEPAQLPTVMRIVRRTTPIRPGQRLFEAAVAMVQDNVGAAIVINQANRLLGLVTEDDILRVLHDHT